MPCSMIMMLSDSSKSTSLTWKADCYISVYDKGVKSEDEEIKKVMMDSFMNSSLTVLQVW